MENKVEFDEIGFEAARSYGKSNNDSLNKAVEKLKAESEEGEYEELIKKMFESLDRKGQRKVISKEAKFSSQVKKALWKKK